MKGLRSRRRFVSTTTPWTIRVLLFLLVSVVLVTFVSIEISRQFDDFFYPEDDTDRYRESRQRDGYPTSDHPLIVGDEAYTEFYQKDKANPDYAVGKENRVTDHKKNDYPKNQVYYYEGKQQLFGTHGNPLPFNKPDRNSKPKPKRLLFNNPVISGKPKPKRIVLAATPKIPEPARKVCPLIEPEEGSECQAGKDCYYNYQYFGGCNRLTCLARDRYSCKNGKTWRKKSTTKQQQQLLCGMHHQRSNVGGKKASPPPPLAVAAVGDACYAPKTIKVFILLGQSNMVGFGTVQGGDDGTLEHAVQHKHRYPYLVDEFDSGVNNKTHWKPVVDPSVWNFFTEASGTEQGAIRTNELLTVQNKESIGPDIGIGYVLGQWLKTEKAKSTDGQHENHAILLLKSCIGGRSLGWDLLPPGSPSFDYTNTTTGEVWRYAGYGQYPYRWKPGSPPTPPESWHAGLQYDGDVARAKEVLEHLPKYIPGTTRDTQYHVEGFFYWQGDKDRFHEPFAVRYRQNLNRLILSLRKEFSSPGAKFVLATLGQTAKPGEDGETSGSGEEVVAEPELAAMDRLVFDAQMEVPKQPNFVGNVACVYSKPFARGGTSDEHYNQNAETFMDVGLEMGRAMVGLLGNGDDVKKERIIA